MIRDTLATALKLLILKAADIPFILHLLDAFDGTTQPTRQVQGRLVYADDVHKPLHHVKVELWDRDFGGTMFGQLLAKGYTDRQGCFLMSYNPKKAGALDTPDLSLKVIERSPYYNAYHKLNYRDRSIYEIKGADRVAAPDYDFGQHPVPYWCYRDDPPGSPPRLALTKLQIIIEGVNTEFRKQLRSLTKQYQGIVFRQSMFPVSVHAVQQLFPLSRTQKIDQRRPGLSRGDAYFADRILNGMNPCLLRQGVAPHQYRLVYNWDAYAAAKNPLYDLHNVEVVFELPPVPADGPADATDGAVPGAAAAAVTDAVKVMARAAVAQLDALADRLIDESTQQLEQTSSSATDPPADRDSSGPSDRPSIDRSSAPSPSPDATVAPPRLMPIRITLETTGADGIKQPPVTYHPGDPRWEQAKRIARTNTLLSGELIAHFVQGHLQTEQFAIPVFRNLRYNPVHLLLFPHLKGVVNVNFRADTTLIGPNGFISQAGPLLWEEGLKPICQDVMGQMDWDQWQPRTPITSRHRYAKTAQLFWDILEEYVATFLKTHHHEICQYWFEIQAMSDDLVDHSVAYKADPVTDWVDQNEAPKPPRQRTADVGQPLKAMSPITEADHPGLGDLDHLKQFCKYAIFHATFWHSWVNDSQVDDGGEIAYSSLALRNGSFSQGPTPETDEEIAPTAAHAAQQLALMHILTQASYGYIVKNEDLDIPPGFIELLKQKDKEFGLNKQLIKNIRSSINI
jgi:Lipoxygenase